MKERVTLTIENGLLKRVDAKVDGVKIKNRSNAVELLLLKALSSNRPRKAVILAGGVWKSAQRLKEDDPNRSTGSMRIVKGKPILEWNIELLKKHGVKEVMLCLTKGRKNIMDYFGDGKKWGVSIIYSVHDVPLGTAGTLLPLKEFITETVIVLNSNELKNIDLDDMYEFHKDGNKVCTIALATVDDPTQFGVAMMNGNRIVTFIEKPPSTNIPSKLVNAGLYIFEPEVLKYIPDGFSILEQDVFPKLAKQDKLFGYLFSGQWFPTKSDDGFRRASNEWKGV